MSFPDIEASLYTYMAALTNLSSAVGARIYSGVAPQDAAYPRITFTVVSDPPDHYMGGASGLSEATVQIDIWTLSSEDRRNVTKLLKNGMDGIVGGNMPTTGTYALAVDSVFLKARRSTEEAPTDNQSEACIFRMSTDWGIWYREALPTLT